MQFDLLVSKNGMSTRLGSCSHNFTVQSTSVIHLRTKFLGLVERWNIRVGHLLVSKPSNSSSRVIEIRILFSCFIDTKLNQDILVIRTHLFGDREE